MCVAVGKQFHYYSLLTYIVLTLLRKGFHSMSITLKIYFFVAFIPTKCHIKQALKMQATSKATCELKTN